MLKPLIACDLYAMNFIGASGPLICQGRQQYFQMRNWILHLGRFHKWRNIEHWFITSMVT